MALVRSDTFGVLSIEPSGPYGLLDAVEPRTDVGLWPAAGMGIAQSYACNDIQPVGHVCQPVDPGEQLAAPTGLTVTPAQGDHSGDAALSPLMAVTAVDACGETLASALVPFTLYASDAQNPDPSSVSWDIAFNEVEGATGYGLYVAESEGGLSGFVASFTGNSGSLTLAQVQSSPGGSPPAENTTCFTGGDAPITKRFDGFESINGYYVTLQGGMSCNALGLNGSDGLDYARTLFAARESAGVEREFLNHVLATSGAVDLTPAGGPVPYRTGLAIAEGYGISNYAGKPYVHSPATIGSALFALGAGIFAGDNAQTRLRNPLVVGAGYDYPSVGPDGEAAEDGSFWIYVTGRPLVARGELNVLESLDTQTNERVVLAERPYLLAVDCMVAAVNVTLED